MSSEVKAKKEENGTEEQLPLTKEEEPSHPEDELSLPDEEVPIEAIDYAALAISDLAEIKTLCKEFASVERLSELPFAHRFAELRDLGLSVREALAAAMPLKEAASGKAHLRSAVPRPSYTPEDSLSHEDMRAAKELFYGLSEKEINALYRRVKH